MSVNLQKGGTISLAKSGNSLSKVFMGLGWDPVKSEKKGFLGGLFGGGGGSIDLDASVVVFDGSKNVLDTVSFSKLKSSDKAILHGGDNLTGEGDGDDEVIYVDLPKLDPKAVHLVFTVNSFRGQTFNEVENATARLVDNTNQQEIATFALAEQGAHTGVIMASLSRKEGEWHMTAHGIPCQGRTVRDLTADAMRVI